jgi:protein TonB
MGFAKVWGRSLAPHQIAGLLLVAALHAAAFWALWQQGLLPTAEQASTLFVQFIDPVQPDKKPEPPKPALQPVKPQPTERPVPQQLVSQAPVLAPTDAVATAPPPQPVVAEVTRPAAVAMAAAPAAPVSNSPVTLEAELSVACPNREPPVYPAQSRRRGEGGQVVLKVVLDEQGRVDEARIHNSSGVPRLDEAALVAVRNWHCTPATRAGRAVRAVALQPFNFVIQGN